MPKGEKGIYSERGNLNLEITNNYKILTIDDESYIRQSIRTYLEDYGFTVFEAANGKQGLVVFEESRPDLVLLDLRMPEMDGLEVLEALKEKAPDIPLVVASGTGNITAVVEALHLGAWDYILKPIEDMTVLYHSVRKCIKESELKTENKRYQEQLEDLVKERTEELQRSEQRYKAIFEYTGTAAIIVDFDDTISMANSKFAELAGMERAEIEGQKKWFDFISPGDIEVFQNYIKHRLNNDSENDAPLQYEIRFLTNQQDEKFVYISLGLIPGTDRAVVSLLDVSEKKKAEKRWQSLEKQLRNSQKMEAIGTLAGGIAHDLNNILSPVLGYADMIMKSTPPENRTYQRSEKILKAAHRAADLVSQVLLFNKRGEEEKRIIKVHPVLQEVIKLLRGSIPSTIKIIDDIDLDCASIMADPTQIHQVIMNLCTNAFHAMEETGGEMKISLNEINLSKTDILAFPNLSQAGRRYIRLQVSDTGCGMENGVLERIFDPYYTTKEEGKGTGLGLATVYSIVKSSNGDIQVKSKPGEGTVFSIFFPVAEGERKTQQGLIDRMEGKVGSGENLLVIDDDKDIGEMCKEGFESLGYRVDLFLSSPSALQYFKENHQNIDAVISDQTMPGMTGLEIAQEMLKIKEDIPIILCSGYGGTISKTKLESVGIKTLIMKPVSVDALSRELQHLIKQRT